MAARPGATPEPRALTANPAVIHDFGGWSPDGTRIAYAANDRDEAHFDVYIQDIASGVRERVFHGSNIVTVSGFRPDAAQLALLHDRGYADMSLLLLDLRIRRGARSSAAAANWQSVRWASDGSTLLALTDPGGSEFMRLCRLDPATGAIDGDIRGARAATWTPGRCRPMRARWPRRERPRLCGSARRPHRRRAPDRRPACRAGIADRPAWSPDSATLAFTAAAPDATAVALAVAATAPRAPCGSPSRTPRSFVDLELVEWPSFDGARIPGWLALPRGAMPAGGYPAIVWVHGGPVARRGRISAPDIQMLVAQGFAVLLPNVRGSTGYGRAYTESDDVEQRLDSVTDLAARAPLARRASGDRRASASASWASPMAASW